MVHTTAYTHQSPLLLDGVAQEDENESEDESPYGDDCDGSENPVPDVKREDSHVEEKLTEFERNQGPEINQCECKCHLAAV